MLVGKPFKGCVVGGPRPYAGSRNLSQPYSNHKFFLKWWLVIVWMIFSAASYAIVVAALIEVARMDVTYGWSTRPQIG